MKRKTSWIGAALVLYVGLSLLAGAVWAQQAGTDTKMTGDVGYLENIAFEKLSVKERVVVMVSRQAGVKVESSAARRVVVTLENTFVPNDLRKAFGEGRLSNVVRVTPVQKSDGAKQWAALTIDLKERVPYSVKQEGNQVVIDFNVSALASRDASAESTANASDTKRQAAATSVPLKSAVPVQTAPSASSQRISVDFQDADIRAVLRLLSEQSGKNIVVSPEVKGSLTLSMKNVPWEQVLDTIQNLYSLKKEESGNVITIMTLDKAKKDDNDRRTAEESRAKAEETLKEKQKKEDAEKGKSRQIMIEAKIVEATDTFSRTLGIQWGGGLSGDIGTSGYTYGMLGGTTPLSSLTKLTTGVALTKDSLALNFPSTSINPSFGIVVGGANAVLNARINALEGTAQGKVISSPRVLIADDEKAIIKQGEEIPVVTPATANTPASTTYKPAVLSLEVKPKIIVDDYLLLTIKAKNDRANRAEKDATTGNMPIYTSEVDSKVAVRDGDTIVIGGVKKMTDDTSTSGLPWLSKIPIFGWLFKSETIDKTSRELLIFVTPRIINKTEASGVMPKKGNGG